MQRSSLTIAQILQDIRYRSEPDGEPLEEQGFLRQVFPTVFVVYCESRGWKNTTDCGKIINGNLFPGIYRKNEKEKL